MPESLQPPITNQVLQELQDLILRGLLDSAGGVISSWDLCVCLGYGIRLAGFSVEEQTRSVHEGKNPGYRKMGDNRVWLKLATT
jgi:hypothetical protein